MITKKLASFSEENLINYEELPEGWTLAKLEDAGQWSTGGTPSRSKPEYYNGSISWIKITDLNDGVVSSTEEKISELGLRNSSAKLLPIGTICVGIYGSIGKIGILGIPSATNQACGNCIVNEKVVNSKFLYFYIISQRRNLLSHGRGGTQANINNKILRKWPLPLPPLSEQHRIVARVEALLSQINAARDRLNRVPLIMKKFRQAVLAAACSGRLTDELDGYESQPAGDLFIDARYGTSNKCDYEEKDKIPVIRIPNIATSKLELSDLKYGSLTENEIDRLMLQEGDIIICRTNGSLDLVGKAAIIPNLPKKFVFASYLIRVRLNRDLLLPEYYHICLSSQIGRDHIEEMARSTAGQFNLNLEILRSMPIPLPLLEEQHEIVSRVDALFALADQIEHQEVGATKRTEALTQAVLGKAFRGELVERAEESV